MILARPNGQTKTNVDDNHTCDCLCVCHETPKNYEVIYEQPLMTVDVSRKSGFMMWEESYAEKLDWRASQESQKYLIFLKYVKKYICFDSIQRQK